MYYSKLNAEECLEYIRDVKHVKLYPHQEYLIRSWFAGRKVFTARCLGRSMCINLIKEYMDAVLETWDDPYPTTPDIRLDYTHGVACGLVTQDTVDHMEQMLNIKQFAKEYKGEY